MKKLHLLTTLLLTVLGLIPALAQPGRLPGPPRGAQFDAVTCKLFGSHQAFSTTIEIQTSGGREGDVTMPGKISLDAGKSRFEMNLSEVKGGKMPAGAAQHMKAMGMDSMIAITRPDLKLTYVVYPGLQSYAAMPAQTTAGEDVKPEDLQVETTELGKETIDGHDCIKNKVVVTGKDGTQHESTVWNATDLKSFPVKIVTQEKDNTVTMQFKDISFDKPAASQFDPPADYTKYDDMQTMMQTEMMKRMGGMGMPPAQH